MKVGYANFRLFAPKIVIMAMSLERSQKDDRIDHATRVYTYW